MRVCKAPEFRRRAGNKWPKARFHAHPPSYLGENSGPGLSTGKCDATVGALGGCIEGEAWPLQVSIISMLTPRLQKKTTS